MLIVAPRREPGAGHALAQAALGEERSFQCAELLVQQVIALGNEADQEAGHHRRRASLEIGPMGLIRRISIGSDPFTQPPFFFAASGREFRQW